MHKFHKELDMDYNQTKSYVNHDDWDNNAQAFAGISVIWPIFWVLTILIFFIKKSVKFSAFVETKLNEQDTILAINDKLTEDNKELQTKLDKIRLENDELRNKTKS